MEKKKEREKCTLGKREEKEEKSKERKNNEEEGRDGKDEVLGQVEGGEERARGEGVKMSWWEMSCMYMQEEGEGWKEVRRRKEEGKKREERRRKRLEQKEGR